MRTFGFRWQNFRSFEDTGWVQLRPITVILGANGSGKTSLIAPLLMLKQTHESKDRQISLKTKGRLFNAGGYADLIFGHQSDRQLGLSLRFSSLPASDEKMGSLGDDPPASIELVYSQQEAHDVPMLTSYVVRDRFGRRMLSRNKTARGSYDLKGLSLPKGNEWTAAVQRSAPTGFLFAPGTVFTQYYRHYRQKNQKSRESGVAESASRDAEDATIPKPHQLYLSTVTFSSASVSRLLRETSYIGPLRDRPRRIYELGGETPFSVGPTGAYAPEILYRTADDRFLQSVNEWVERFEFGQYLQCKALASDVFNITLRRSPHSPAVNIADTGFGLSQVLPLIVQGFCARRNALIIAEQPEIHLNPKLQGVLGDLFAAVAKRGVGVLVETHSEHLVLRLRRLVAENTLRAQDVALYYVERDGDASQMRRIPLEDNGSFGPAGWPRGFFEDALKDSLALATAQARRGNDAE